MAEDKKSISDYINGIIGDIKLPEVQTDSSIDVSKSTKVWSIAMVLIVFIGLGFLKR